MPISQINKSRVLTLQSISALVGVAIFSVTALAYDSITAETNSPPASNPPLVQTPLFLAAMRDSNHCDPESRLEILSIHVRFSTDLVVIKDGAYYRELLDKEILPAIETRCGAYLSLFIYNYLKTRLDTDGRAYAPGELLKEREVAISRVKVRDGNIVSWQFFDSLLAGDHSSSGSESLITLSAIRFWLLDRSEKERAVLEKERESLVAEGNDLRVHAQDLLEKPTWLAKEPMDRASQRAKEIVGRVTEIDERLALLDDVEMSWERH